MKGAVEAEQKKQLAGLEDLEKKLLKAEKRKHESSTGQLEKMAEKHCPGGGPQERYDNFMPFYLSHGAGFIQLLIEKLDPLTFELTVVTE